jgi:hypothetical protein
MHIIICDNIYSLEGVLQMHSGPGRYFWRMQVQSAGRARGVLLWVFSTVEADCMASGASAVKEAFVTYLGGLGLV